MPSLKPLSPSVPRVEISPERPTSVATVDMQCLSLSASNEIPESELLKDVIYAFQGIEGKWIKFDTGRDSYRIDSQVKIFPTSTQGPRP